MAGKSPFFGLENFLKKIIFIAFTSREKS